jgi:hypothetical protein
LLDLVEESLDEVSSAIEMWAEADRLRNVGPSALRLHLGVRVHQHAACIARNRRQSMGRSRGGLTSKIHAVVDTNGLPAAGEAHDNRPALKLLSCLSKCQTDKIGINAAG